MNVTLIDSDYFSVIRALGYPAVSKESIENEFPRDHIMNYPVTDAFKEYFRWFPLPTEEYHAITPNSPLTLTYPDPSIFTVMDIRLIPANVASGGRTGNPFVTERNVMTHRTQKLSGGYTLGTSSIELNVMQQQATSAMLHGRKGLKVTKGASEVTVTSQVQGKILIVFGGWSADINAIPWDRRKEVLELAQAYLLKEAVNVREMANEVNVESQFNTNYMEKRADDLEDRVLNRWKTYTKVAIV